MDFFAIVGGSSPSVFRMDIRQDLQAELTRKFALYAHQFLDDQLVRVPFARENFHPDDSEILQISPFDLPELLFDPLENVIGWQTLPLDDETLSRVYCVFGYDQDQELVVFQVIPKSQRLTRGGLNMVLNGKTFTKLDAPGLMLGSGCHAVYQDSALVFKSMWWLKQVIDISSYYREATDADVDALAQLEGVHVEDVGLLKQKAGQWVRSRIAYILDSGVLVSCSASELVSKAVSFGVSLQTTSVDGKDCLVIPKAPKELRSVLKFLEEEYYEGPITGVAYEANSKRRR